MGTDTPRGTSRRAWIATGAATAAAGWVVRPLGAAVDRSVEPNQEPVAAAAPALPKAFVDGNGPDWVTLGPDDFARPLNHPEVGAMNVDVLLEIYGWHAPHHEGHITALRDRMGWS